MAMREVSVEHREQPVVPVERIVAPTVHLNGTSRDALAKQYEDAALALRAAIEKLGSAAPHGRDYYVQDPHAITRAIVEHTDRLRRLEDVYDELTALWESVQP